MFWKYGFLEYNIFKVCTEDEDDNDDLFDSDDEFDDFDKDKGYMSKAEHESIMLQLKNAVVEEE